MVARKRSVCRFLSAVPSSLSLSLFYTPGSFPGGLLDYTNPAAVTWWHNQLDNVLSLGADGWKCDGTDPYIMELIEPQGFNGTISYREYADLYYGDSFDYTRCVSPSQSLFWSVPLVILLALLFYRLAEK
jgi:hypothetical protein